MKLNKFVLGFAVMAAFGFASCGDDFDFTDEPSPVCENDAVRFSDGNAAMTEIDPSNPVFAVVVKRDATQAASYTLTVIENQENAFSVPSTVTFAEGEKEVSVPVGISENAPTATDLSLTLSLQDDQVNPYKSEMAKRTFTINIVKWNNLGTGQWLDGFWYGFWDEVQIQQRDDKPEIFRCTNPYTNELCEAYGESNHGTYTKYLTFELKKNGQITWEKYFTFNTMYDDSNEIWAVVPSALTDNKADDAGSKAEFDEEGNIQYFTIDPYWYISGMGGWGPGEYPCYLAFPGVDLATEFEW